jgi:predicted transcriptional regulator
MAANLTAGLDGIPRKTLAMGGESLRKPLAEDLKRAIGAAIARALVLADMTKQDAAHRMGYEDQSALSRWISGAETPQFARLFEVAELRTPLVVALAEIVNSDEIEISTHITVRRRA